MTENLSDYIQYTYYWRMGGFNLHSNPTIHRHAVVGYARFKCGQDYFIIEEQNPYMKICRAAKVRLIGLGPRGPQHPERRAPLFGSEATGKLVARQRVSPTCSAVEDYEYFIIIPIGSSSSSLDTNPGVSDINRIFLIFYSQPFGNIPPHCWTMNSFSAVLYRRLE